MSMTDLKCKNCGGTIEPEENGLYAVCEYCGSRQEIEADKIMPVNSISKSNTGKSIKSKTTAGLLAVFLGAFGLHNFYLGYKTKGIIQLVLTLTLCWTYVAPIIVWIWTIVEAVLIFQGKLQTSDGKALL